jgi:hypothetical protein
LGQLVLNKEISNGQTSVDLDIQRLVAGFYNIECYDGAGVRIANQSLVVDN